DGRPRAEVAEEALISFRHRPPDRKRHKKRRCADHQEKRRHGNAVCLHERDDNRRAGHERRIEHIDRSDRTRAIVGAGPSLHCGEGRHDEQPAGNGKPGKIDGGAKADRRCEDFTRRTRRQRWHHATGCQPEIEREGAEQHRASQGRIEYDSSARDRRCQGRSGGNSDSTTMPVSQNQLVTIAPHHSRASARRWPIIAAVEAVIFTATLSCGAPSPVGGISKLASQQPIAKPINSMAKPATSPPLRAASPPTVVPIRMATKVAPSTNALPVGNSSRRKWSGRMPYLIGPNNAASTPKPASAA